MLLFLKGLIVGIGKIIPGVSGAMLAIYFNVYERTLNAVANFFEDCKNNFKFLFIFGLGILVSIVLGSKLISYLFNHYSFITMLFFIGLMLGGTYSFTKKIKYQYKNIILLFITIIIFSILLFINPTKIYFLKHNFIDNLIFLIGGFIDAFASIVPGISGTSLLMIMGIYQAVLEMTSQVFNFTYIIHNFNLYFSYSIGLFLSFIINTFLMNYLLKKHKNITYTIILGLSITSIFFLLLLTLKLKFTFLELIIGLILFIMGITISSILDK